MIHSELLLLLRPEKKKKKAYWCNPVFHTDGFMCLGFPMKSTELNKKINFEISGRRVGPLVENVETVDVQIRLAMSVHGEKKLETALLLPQLCFSDAEFKIKLMRERAKVSNCP